ncbi:hypothetical protein ACLOJK_022754 [Asimina triloba]
MMTPPNLLDLLWSKTREKMGNELVVTIAGDREDDVRSRWNRTRGLTVVLLDDFDQSIKALTKMMRSGSSRLRRHFEWLGSVNQTLPEELTAGNHGCRPLMKTMEHHNRCSGSAP